MFQHIVLKWKQEILQSMANVTNVLAYLVLKKRKEVMLCSWTPLYTICISHTVFHWNVWNKIINTVDKNAFKFTNILFLLSGWCLGEFFSNTKGKKPLSQTIQLDVVIQNHKDSI